MEENERGIRFIIAVFGNRYIGMLTALIYSISNSNADARISVFYQDMPERVIEVLKKSFPQTTFTRTAFDLQGDAVIRVASKTLFWNYAIEQTYPERTLVFLDVDMLVLKDLALFFDDSFDLLFTTKEEHCPINTGIVLVQNGPAAKKFFAAWMERTFAIIRSPELSKKASGPAFGAPDQMAFLDILTFERNRGTYTLAMENQSIVCKAVDCRILNETHSIPLPSADSHVLHYKGGWQPILLEGTGFTIRRPKKASWDMYLFYLQTYRKAVETIRARAGENLLPQHYVKIPFYLNSEYRESLFLYRLYRLGTSWTRISLRVKRKIKKLAAALVIKISHKKGRSRYPDK